MEAPGFHDHLSAVFLTEGAADCIEVFIDGLLFVV